MINATLNPDASISVKPLPYRVLVELLPAYSELKNPLNLDLSVAAEKKKHFDHIVRRGKVIAVGRGVYDVQEGDLVIFQGYAGTSFGRNHKGKFNDGTNYRSLSVQEILCIEEQAEEIQ